MDQLWAFLVNDYQEKCGNTEVFFWGGGDKINTLQGPNISHLGEKEQHHLLQSALKKGDMIFFPGGFGGEMD